MERTKSRAKDFRRDKSNMTSGKPAGLRARLQPLSQDRVIFGFHAAEAALLNPKRTIKHAYLTENAALKLGSLITARRIAVNPANPQDLDALVGPGMVHQGIVLQVEPIAQPALDEILDALPKGAPATLAMLDQVTDPHNVGAVMRSAAAFGIAAMIVQDRHSPPLSGTLAKAASGALEHVPVIATVNLARALDRLKDYDFQCVGFDSDAGNQFSGDALTSPRTVFVFGAEDKGLRRLIREGCDVLCSLCAPGPIQSLNISNAAAIVFHEAAKGRPTIVAR